MWTYVAMAVVLVVLIGGLYVRMQIIYRSAAIKLVPMIAAMRRLATQTITYRAPQGGEAITADVAPRFEAARRELTAAGLTVFGELMEVPPEGVPKPTLWFIDPTHTICGWFGLARDNPVMMLFSEADRDAFFITGRGGTATATAQPPTNHRSFLPWGIGLAQALERHKAQIAESGTRAITQPATLEAGPALVGRLRDTTARWRASQPQLELVERDVRALVGKQFKNLGPTLIRLLTTDAGAA